MVIRGDNSLWAWGANDFGQLGMGIDFDEVGMSREQFYSFKPSRYAMVGTIYSDVPIWVMDDVVEISAGTRLSMATTSDGNLWAWGLNFWGFLGDGTDIERHTPVRIMDNIMLPN